jgi:hypothetical protein
MQQFDYKNVDAFTERYLATYYNEITDDELAIAQFLVQEYKKIAGKPAMLEVGCGPTIHHVLPIVPYVSSIDMTDYLPGNIRAISLWKKQVKNAHNWQFFTKKILALENTKQNISSVNIEQREMELRNKIHSLSECNVLHQYPLGYKKQYPIVGLFYCVEEVAIAKECWKQAMANVMNMVLPEGRFFTVCLWETDYYSIISDTGTVEKLPTAYVTEQDMWNLLKKNGFDESETIIKIAKTPSQIEQGINGVILVSTKKR